jgi:hypothetical protein
LRISILLLIPVKVTAYAAALANIIPIGIVRMSRILGVGIACIATRPHAHRLAYTSQTDAPAPSVMSSTVLSVTG